MSLVKHSLPSCILAVVALTTACGAEPEPASDPPRVATRAAAPAPAGQVQDLASTDGSLLVRVPIEAQQGRDFATYWVPEIRDAAGLVLLRDELGFPARFNVYWAWDGQQRLWLYNTDDGTVWVYAAAASGWARQPWERGSGQEPPPEIRARLARAP